MLKLQNGLILQFVNQQLFRFSALLDHVTEITCALFKSVQFQSEEGNFKSGFRIELLLPFAIAR